MSQQPIDIDSMDMTIQIKGKDANTILAGLGKLPAENSFDVILKVKGQAEQQVAKAMQPQVANEAAPAGQQLLTEDKQ